MKEEEEEIHRLLNRFLHGDLSEDDFCRLEKFLIESEEARQLYFRYVDLDAELRKSQSVESVREPVAELRRALDDTFSEPRSPRHWSTAAVMLAAAACISGLLAVGSFFFQRMSSSAPAHVSQELVGSVLRAPEAGVFQSGERIATGLLDFPNGRHLIRLNNGALLNIEGPAKIELVSQSRAILREGRVTVRCPASAIGFVLEGPGLSAVDLGTEFGMSATGGNAELHVFEGEVQWRSADRKSGLLEEGAALVSIQRAESVTEIPASDREFDRNFSKPDPVHQSGRLLAYEGFDYDTERLQRGNGGRGWADTWLRGGTDRPIGLRLRKERSLGGSPSSLPSTGGLLELQGFKGAWRKLAEPLDLSVDGRRYLSFLLRKARLDREGDPSYMICALSSSSDLRVIAGAGFNEDDHLFTLHAGDNDLSQTKIPLGDTRLVVVRIDAHARFPDEVRVTLLDPASEGAGQEPVNWLAVGHPRSGDEVLDHIVIRNGRGAIYEIDEIRIGETWTSVTR